MDCVEKSDLQKRARECQALGCRAVQNGAESVQDAADTTDDHCAVGDIQMGRTSTNVEPEAANKEVAQCIAGCEISVGAEDGAEIEVGGVVEQRSSSSCSGGGGGGGGGNLEQRGASGTAPVRALPTACRDVGLRDPRHLFCVAPLPLGYHASHAREWALTCAYATPSP